MLSEENEILTESVRMVTECLKRLKHDVDVRQCLRVEDDNFVMRLVGLKMHIQEAHMHARRLADMAEQGPALWLGDREHYERLRNDLIRCADETQQMTFLVYLLINQSPRLLRVVIGAISSLRRASSFGLRSCWLPSVLP